jgi:hypothetical protein
LASVEVVAAQLEERSTSVKSRMDVAEARFVDLSRQAGEAERVATTIAGVTTEVDAAEDRMDKVSKSLEALEEQAALQNRPPRACDHSVGENSDIRIAAE